ncbi:hypothetical protein CEXT_57981 [Caerostris extrusa]|uniref:Uncharacterized protein n=1 Tax=Caerostris extrusa TaxID=172846 RepID=A0AAV4R0N4_CAEEX|nr:hypothetical protein CEXT_57981 [Caerostris extrusa]
MSVVNKKTYRATLPLFILTCNSWFDFSSPFSEGHCDPRHEWQEIARGPTEAENGSFPLWRKIDPYFARSISAGSRLGIRAPLLQISPDEGLAGKDSSNFNNFFISASSTLFPSSAGAFGNIFQLLYCERALLLGIIGSLKAFGFWLM